MKHEHQIVIRRPLSDVFEYMDDVDRESEWQPNIVEAYKDPLGPTAIGTKKKYVSRFMGKRIENTYVTTLFESNRRVVYETTKASALTARAELRFETVDGGTRVTMAFEGKVGGPLKLVPRRILDAAYKKESESSLKLLKERLENG